jgi:hypothetical protein
VPVRNLRANVGCVVLLEATDCGEVGTGCSFVNTLEEHCLGRHIADGEDPNIVCDSLG